MLMMEDIFLNYAKVFNLNSEYNLQLEIQPWQQLFNQDTLRKDSVQSLDTLIEESSRSGSASIDQDHKELAYHRQTMRLSVWQNRVTAFDWKKFEFNSAGRISEELPCEQ